jgi:hypothetical protein
MTVACGSSSQPVKFLARQADIRTLRAVDVRAKSAKQNRAPRPGARRQPDLHDRMFAITPWRLVEYWKMTSSFNPAEYEIR